VTLIVVEGNNSFFEVLPWAMLMGVAAIIAFASAHVAEPRNARNLLVGAAALYGVIGAVSILSIGFGFLLAAAAVAIAIARLSAEKTSD
jgi:hypothetical protein